MQVFGKLAKGAAALSGAENESPLEQLMHRIRESSALPEKRTALQEVKDTLQEDTEAKSVFGSLGGISLMVDLLTERDDLELVQMALETLALSFTAEGSQTTVATSTNCELFIQSVDHLAVVLSLLEPEPNGISDFYVYYHTVQILNSCLKTGLYKLQEVVHRRKDGLNGLLRLLSEREAIRNEVLLILIQITSNHPVLQEAAARGGIFGRLFEILKGEGGSEGGIVVRDCFDLMRHILSENEATQEIFRENGFLQHLLKFLELVDVSALGAPALINANQNISQQRIDNIKLALKLADLLVSENEACMKDTYMRNCFSLNHADCLPVFSQLCLNEGGVRDAEVRAISLRCMSRVLLFTPDAKRLLVKLRVFVNAQPTEALLVLLRVTLSAQEREEASMALSALDSFYDSNREGQERAFSSLIPFEGCPPVNETFISEVMKSVETCREGSEAGRKAVQVMTCLIKHNPSVQNAIVTHSISLPQGQNPNRLLYWMLDLLSEALKFGSNPGICDALSDCVMHCLEGCPLAVEALLRVESHVTLLVGHLQNSIEEIMNLPNWKPSSVSAVALIFAMCLATVVEHNPNHPSSEAMCSYLRNVVEGSVGVDNFFFFLGSLYDKAKGSTHEYMNRRLSHILPLLQSYFHPDYSSHDYSTGELLQSANTAQQAGSMNQGNQAGTGEETAQKLTNLQSELDATRKELQQANDELGILSKQQRDNSLLREQLSQQETVTEELRKHTSALEAQLDKTIDADTRNEIMVCLGIEHTKVQILSKKLFELGYDPDALLSTEMVKHL